MRVKFCFMATIKRCGINVPHLNGGVGLILTNLISNFTKNNSLTCTDLLTLNIGETDDCTGLSVCWFIGTAFVYLWNKRCEKKKTMKEQVLAEIEAQYKIITQSNMHNHKILVKELISMFVSL